MFSEKNNFIYYYLLVKKKKKYKLVECHKRHVIRDSLSELEINLLYCTKLKKLFLKEK